MKKIQKEIVKKKREIKKGIKINKSTNGQSELRSKKLLELRILYFYV